jgi:pimeloyl-ACP methyl ester carboxylesterase
MRYAVVLPGSGSSVEFVTRAFGPPLAAAGYELHALPPGDSLPAAVARYRPALLGGVSLGAHLVARWAAGRGAVSHGRTVPADGTPVAAGSVVGLLLALPAWTGAPGAVAAASAYAAGRVESRGTRGARAEASAGAEPWVAAELAAAWPGYGDGLAGTLRAAAATPGPTEDELRRIGVPAGILAFTDDPLHPLAVAERWAALIPRAALSTLALADPAPDRAILGATVLAALGRV